MQNSLFPKILFMVFFVVLVFIRPVHLLAALTEISAVDMDRDMVCQDMEGCPLGFISGTHACFTSIFLREAILLGGWYDDSDIVSSGPVGNALCCYRDQLTIAKEDDYIYDAESGGAGYRFELATGITAKQFSFRPVDQVSWTAEISVYSGGSLLSSVTRSISAYESKYFQSSDSFDAFQITTTSSTGGWCVDDLCIASFDSMPSTPTPTITPTPTNTRTIPGSSNFCQSAVFFLFQLVFLVFLRTCISGMQRKRTLK